MPGAEATSGGLPGRVITVGKISGLHGLHGGVKVFSYTRPKEKIFTYCPWLLRIENAWMAKKIVSRGDKTKGLVAYLEGITDANQAKSLLGAEVAVQREQLAELPAGAYYWCDLINLEVIDGHGRSLGKIMTMQETGANDVMIVQGERVYLIPWVMHKVIKRVDIEAGRVYLDWDPEYQ
jgi:16S rRNA processing protein RimM